jgi:PAS domain S-box-containing protein
MPSKLFDRTVLGDAELALEFIGNILESSTEYSIIGKDLDGTILLWNEGARRMYGYESAEVVGQANSALLHTPEDVALGKPQEMMDVALRDGKWEGIIGRIRKDGRRITARVVLTARRDNAGTPIGFLLISKEISHELRFSEDIRQTKLFDRAIVSTAQDAVDFIANMLPPASARTRMGGYYCGTKAPGVCTATSRKK